MERRKLVISAVISALLAGVSLVLFARDLEQRHGLGGKEIELVVSTRKLAAGSTLKADQLSRKRIPASYAPPRGVPAKELELLAGSSLTVALQEGEVLQWSDLKARGLEDAELSTVIPKGARALAVPMNSNSSPGPLLRPNDHVDILGTFTSAKERGPETITLLQNVVVLAVGDVVGAADGSESRSGHPSRASSVMVAVTPEEAELLTHAMERGKLSLTLRNPDDIASVEALADRKFATLFEPEVRKAIQQKRNDTIEIIGGKRRR